MKDKITKKELYNRYKYVVAWGKYLGSFDPYINNQCLIALDDNAPEDATYKNDAGVWQIADEKLKENLKHLTPK